MSDLFIYLWNLIISILQGMGQVWTFLTTPITIAQFEIFGVVLFEGVVFTPLAFGGAFILIVLGIGLISLLNPMT